ncbi:MAG: transcription antitermination factor NusB [Bacilli bacterium]
MEQLSRTKQQFVVMTIIYNVLADLENNNSNVFLDPRNLISNLCECDYEDAPEYIKKLVYVSLKNYGDIVNAITPHLNGWRWARIPLLSRSIIVMSYAHYYFYGDNPEKRIVIDIAINLAKKYVEEKQASFINALLDTVLK